MQVCVGIGGAGGVGGGGVMCGSILENGNID